MNPRDIINEAASRGVVLSVRNGKIQYSGEAQEVAAVLPLLRQHKDAIVRELSGEPSGSPRPLDKTDKTHKTPLPMPGTLTEDLLCCGYRAPEWTPAGCRAFLADLQDEWPDFELRGWHGCRFPACWPVHLMSAVQSVYVMSIQDQGGCVL